MAKKKNEIDICCACGKDMPDENDLAFVNFRYQVPGSGVPEQILVASTCDACAKDAEDINHFPVIEALINARLIRIEFPDKSFVPEGK